MENTFTQMMQQMLPDSGFNDELDANISFVDSSFKADPKTKFMPMLIARTNRNERTVMAIADMPGDAEKRHKMFYDILHSLGKDQKFKTDHGFIVALFLLTEAWMRGQVDKNEKISLPIADNPMKTEVMICSGRTIDGRNNMAMIPMLRSKEDSVMLDMAHITKTPYVGDTNRDLESFILQKAFAGYVLGIQEAS